MKKIHVEVREDHLALLSQTKPMTAMAELIWNAFDAEASEVRVIFDENDLGGVERVRVVDNGHGLHYDHAQVVFRNLGGSWKRDGTLTTNEHRLLHGRYGKGRFRAFRLANGARWRSAYRDGEQTFEFTLSGHAASPGEFELSNPEPTEKSVGVIVELRDLANNIEILRGVKAVEEITDLFALYLRQYPGLRLVYDGVPIDPTNAETHCADYPLDDLVSEDGERLGALLTVVEWNMPGKRGIVLCDDEGFALQTARPKPYFRGFSYTAYLKSAHLGQLDQHGLLQVDEMAPDLRVLLDAVRTRLRQHFALREAELALDVLARWKETGLYPYEDAPMTGAEETERRVFDIYATHLNQISDFSSASMRNKRLILRMLQELVNTQPTRVARLLDEMLTLPEEKEEELSDLLLQD